MWLWIAGAVVLAAGAVVPPWLVRARGRRAQYAAARDRAQAAMSRLETALDTSQDTGDAAVAARTAARRCLTLAGAELAGPDTTEGFRRAEERARQGLTALGIRD